MGIQARNGRRQVSQVISIFLIRFRILLATATAVCLLLSLTCLLGEDQIGTAAAQGKGKPAPRASVTIDSGFDISADGLGTYVDGRSGVDAQIWAGGSEDLTLNLNNSKRYFNVYHTFQGCGGFSCSAIENGAERGSKERRSGRPSDR